MDVKYHKSVVLGNNTSKKYLFLSSSEILDVSSCIFSIKIYSSEKTDKRNEEPLKYNFLAFTSIYILVFDCKKLKSLLKSKHWVRRSYMQNFEM